MLDVPSDELGLTQMRTQVHDKLFADELYLACVRRAMDGGAKVDRLLGAAPVRRP